MEFTKILLSETYRRSIGDLSETHRRPPFLIVDIDMLHRGDPTKTDMPQYIIPIHNNKLKVYKNKNISMC